MNNDVLLVPITVEQPNVEAQSDIVVYVPQAHKNKAGIVKEGDGILVENGVVSLDKTLVQDMVDAVDAALTDEILDVDDKIVAHINDVENPHRVTKEQIGLSNVDNTSDSDKPISNATKIELDDIKTTLKGYNKSVAYASYREMIDVLNVAQKDDFFTGQSIFINTKDVPDLWVFGVEETQQQYVYSDDDAILDTIKDEGFVWIGYYKIAALETQKTIVGNYVTLDTPQTLTAFKGFYVQKENNLIELFSQNDRIYLYNRSNSSDAFASLQIYPNSVGISSQNIKLESFSNDVSLRISSAAITLTKGDNELSLSYGGLTYNTERIITANDVDSNYVSYTTQQSLTEEQKQIARNNIGAGTGNGGGFGTLKKEIVETLPTTNIDENTIYLILKQDGSGNDYYDEYLYINGSFESIGNTRVDLSNYVTLDTEQTITGIKKIDWSKDSTRFTFNMAGDFSTIEWSSKGSSPLTADIYEGSLWMSVPSVFEVGWNPEVDFRVGRNYETKDGYARISCAKHNETSVKSVLNITPTAITYNNKEIATKDDIQSAIVTTLNTVV